MRMVMWSTALVLSGCKLVVKNEEKPVTDPPPYEMACGEDLVPDVLGSRVRRCVNEEVVCYLVTGDNGRGAVVCRWLVPS